MLRPEHASVFIARQSGAWDEMNQVDLLLILSDRRLKLESDGHALTFFEASPPWERRNILRCMASAKTDATRNRRIESASREAGVNKRIKSSGKKSSGKKS